MKDSQTSVVAIIVNYFKARRAVDCVLSILSQDYQGEIQVIIVDNSDDGNEWEQLCILDKLSEVQLIRAPENLGYTKAVNIAARSGSAAADILLVSPDIILDRDNIISSLRAQLDTNSSIGVLCPLQKNDDGSSVEVGRKFPSPAELFYRRTRTKTTDLTIIENFQLSGESVQDVDWVQSSFNLIRRTVWDIVGGMEEDYFLFQADTEFCLKTWEAGFRVCISDCAPGVRADGIRASAGGIIQVFTKPVVRRHIRDAATLYRRNGFKMRRKLAVSLDRELL